MPNIANIFRDEIVRLSRKESRAQIGLTKKATIQHRKDIAALKRQVAELERQLKMLMRRSFLAPKAAAKSEPASGTKIRFVVKGLRSQRKRLGLSAGDFGKLMGVSAQSVYNWESGLTRPRDEQISRLVKVRAMGKRDAAESLHRIAKPS